MPRQRRRPDSSGSAAPSPSSREETAGSLDTSQVHRLAMLIADGQSEVPANLSDAEQERLCEEVRRRRRDRLIRHLARVLALDLRRGPRP